MIPRIIHQVWLGSRSPDAEQWRRNWAATHPDFRYQLWADEDLGWLDARHQFELARQQAIRADIARLEILYREGGVYADADITPHRSIEPLLDGVSLVVLSEGDLLTNAFMAAAPGHPTLGKALDLLRSLPDSAFNVTHWGLPQTGPLLLTRAVCLTGAAFDPQTRVLPPDFACIPRSRIPQVVELAEQRRWMTHAGDASWKDKRSMAERARSTKLRTRVRRFLDLSAP